MKLNLLMAVVACGLMGLTASADSTRSQWEQPATTLAAQIADILGPGQARLTMRNFSSIPANEIPAIRQLIEQDLKAHGVLASGAESANEIRVSLSENQRERLWVAEVVEGNETRVAMVRVDFDAARAVSAQERLVLRKERYLGNAELSLPPILSNDQPILAILECSTGLAVLRQDEVLIFAMTMIGWKERTSLDFDPRLPLPNDPRGMLLPTTDGFTAFVPGKECKGSYAPRTDNSGDFGDWSIKCHASDDPWQIVQSDAANGSLKAFYNSARNYFTGVVSPSLGVDLPPFYTTALLPRSADGRALLIGGIDGKVQLLENGALKQMSGARDWGSDFAVLHSGCGAGTQIIASGSGEAKSDSLRAYELPAQEAVPVSAALAMDGTVTALWSAPDGKRVFAVVRSATDQYEVDRVTATCNE